MLGDGERAGVGESLFGGGGIAEGELAFAEEDVDDHPIGFAGGQLAKVVGGFAVFARVAERLSEAEAGKVVAGKLGEQLPGLGDARLTHAVVIWLGRAR